jgi:4-diphosphocytidyl-2-C-methyl-D-erythritol kinase
LTLRILGRRDDGFHEIESLVLRVGLHDRLSVTPAGQRTELRCDHPAIPCGQDNLVLKALQLFQTTAQLDLPALRIELKKVIPPGAGLGGGSSNAAAMLTLLAKIAPDADVDLFQLAAQLGSDIPLFLSSSPAIIRGRGERISPLPFHISGWVALILPEIHCATSEVYAALGLKPGQAQVPSEPLTRTINPAMASLSATEALTIACNDLEPAAFRIHPRLREIHRAAERLAAGPVRMSGSGSALYRLFDKKDDAATFAASVRDNLKLRCEIAEIL